MLEKLKDYPLTIKKLFNYLKMKNVDLMAFAKMPIEQQLGYYLTFLAFEGVNIEVNAHGCICYFIQLGEFIKNESWNESLVIYKESHQKNNNVIEDYNKCVIACFKRLDNPF